MFWDYGLCDIFLQAEAEKGDVRHLGKDIDEQESKPPFLSKKIHFSPFLSLYFVIVIVIVLRLFSCKRFITI